MLDFVHLHLHTEYSLLDGATKIEDVFKIAKRAVHIAVVGYSHGVLPKPLCYFKYVFNFCSTVKQAVLCMQVQMNKIQHFILSY